MPPSVPTSLRPAPPPHSPRALAVWAGKAGSVPRKRGERGRPRGPERGGPGWEGRGGAGRAAIAPAAAPEQSRGRRDPRPSAATESATRSPDYLRRPASRAAPAASHRPGAPETRGAGGPGQRGAGSPHPSRDVGGAGRVRGLGGRRPASLWPTVRGALGLQACWRVGGAVCLGTEGLRFSKVVGPCRQGLCRSSGAFWGSAEYPSQGESGVREGCGPGPPGSAVPSEQPP